jgi:hypothetical protein
MADSDAARCKGMGDKSLLSGEDVIRTERKDYRHHVAEKKAFMSTPKVQGQRKGPATAKSLRDRSQLRLNAQLSHSGGNPISQGRMPDSAPGMRRALPSADSPLGSCPEVWSGRY